LTGVQDNRTCHHYSAQLIACVEFHALDRRRACGISAGAANN
jgi:hypothetical protein